MAVISLVISMQLWNSCRSSNTQQNEEIKYISKAPVLYFPKFPDPKVIVPLNEDFKIVRDEETDIMYDVIPHWYLLLILDYKLKVDEAKLYYDAFIEENKIIVPP